MGDNRLAQPFANRADARLQTWPRPGDSPGSFEKLLLISSGAALAADTTAAFRIKTPDVKCMVKVTVFIILPDGSTLRYLSDDSTGATAAAGAYAGGVRLWCASLTRAKLTGGQLPPTREIVPQRGNGLLLPTSPDLWGYEIIEQTIGDEVYGELTCKASEGGVANAPAAGVNWAVRVDFQSTTAMTNEEWAALVGRASLSAGAKNLA